MIDGVSCGSPSYAINPQVVQPQGAGTETVEEQATIEAAAPVQAEGVAIQASQSLLDFYA